jgi:hypothetical protein
MSEPTTLSPARVGRRRRGHASALPCISARFGPIPSAPPNQCTPHAASLRLQSLPSLHTARERRLLRAPSVRAGRGRNSHAPAAGETVGCEHTGTHAWNAHFGGHSARATRRRGETCCASRITSAVGTPNPIARLRLVSPTEGDGAYAYMQLHAINLRVAASRSPSPTTRCAAVEPVEFVLCLSCEIYKRRSRDRSTPHICVAAHAKSLLRQMRACKLQKSSSSAAKSRASDAQTIRMRQH